MLCTEAIQCCLQYCTDNSIPRQYWTLYCAVQNCHLNCMMYSIDNCTALWYSITKCTALLDYTSVVQLSVQRAHCFCTHFCTVQLNAMFWHCFCTDVLHCCNGRALLHCCLCHCCWSLLCRVCDLNQSWAVAVLSPNIGHISMKRELGGGGGGGTNPAESKRERYIKERKRARGRKRGAIVHAD